MTDENLDAKTDLVINTSDIKVNPLVDVDGVHHQGRVITLSGESWMRNRDIIANMTDEELKAKLASLTLAVREAELVLDYRKILKNHVENESEGRYNKKQNRLRLLRKTYNYRHIDDPEAMSDALHPKSVVVSEGHGGSKRTSKEQNADMKGAFGTLGKLGLTKDQMLKLIAALAEGKGKK